MIYYSPFSNTVYDVNIENNPMEMQVYVKDEQCICSKDRNKSLCVVILFIFSSNK